MTGDEQPLTAAAAKKLADEHLRTDGASLVACRATRNRRYGVWLVDCRDPAHPEELIVGGALVVTDAGRVYSTGSVPGALDDLMLALGLWPGAEPAEVFGHESDELKVPAGTDAEALLLLADDDQAEIELVARAAARRPWPGVLDDERSTTYFRALMGLVKVERARLGGAVYRAEEDVFAAFQLNAVREGASRGSGPGPVPESGSGDGVVVLCTARSAAADVAVEHSRGDACGGSDSAAGR